VESTPGSYYPSGETAQTATLYIHPTDSTDPAVNGKTYEFSRRLYGVLAEVYSGTNLRGIHCRRNVSVNGSIFVGKDSIVSECVAEDGNKHNMFVRGGSIVSKSLIDNCYYGAGNSLLFVAYENTNPQTDVVISQSVCKIDTPSMEVSGFAGHTTTGTFKQITVTDCAAFNCGNGFNFADTDSVTLNNPIASTVGLVSGAGVAASGRVDIYGGMLVNASAISAGTGADVVVRGGTVLEANSGSGQIVRGIATGALSVDIQDSVITNSLSWLVQVSAPSSNLIFQNNKYNNTLLGYDISDASTASLMVSDFNIWSQEAVQNRLDGVTYTTLTEYKAATGKDQNSTIG
jgi:hypothetical protein